MDTKLINLTELDRNQKFECSYEEKVDKILSEAFEVPTWNIKSKKILDMEKATDRIVHFTPFKSINVAIRIRRPEYRAFKHQFTLREMLQSGEETELSKIRKGCADYLLYGFLNETGEIDIWFIGDLDNFRKYEPMHQCIKNHDPNQSWFAVFNLCDCNKDFIRSGKNL